MARKEQRASARAEVAYAKRELEGRIAKSESTRHLVGERSLEDDRGVDREARGDSGPTPSTTRTGNDGRDDFSNRSDC